MYKLKVDLYHKVNISRLYSTYDDATTSLTEHIYRYILRGGLILSDSIVEYMCTRTRSSVYIYQIDMGGGCCCSPPYIRTSFKN